MEDEAPIFVCNATSLCLMLIDAVSIAPQGSPLASASRIDLSASNIACEQGAMILQT